MVSRLSPDVRLGGIEVLNPPRQYRTKKKASTLIAARIKYRPHDMAVMMGGVTCATIKFEIHRLAVHKALPFAYIGC